MTPEPGSMVVCDFDNRPHPLNEDDRMCRNPKPATYGPEPHPSWCKCQRVCGGDQ